MEKIEKHRCQKLVAMETSKKFITWCKCQNIPRRCLGKVAKFGDYSINLHEVIHLQSRAGLKPPPPPPGVWIGLTKKRILEILNSVESNYGACSRRGQDWKCFLLGHKYLFKTSWSWLFFFLLISRSNLRIRNGLKWRETVLNFDWLFHWLNSPISIY